MKPTTYIFGAGLCAPFGFPTGLQLMNTIRQYHESPHKYLCERYIADDSANVVYDRESGGEVKLHKGTTRQRKTEFYNFLHKAGKSYISSIDSFVHQNQQYEYPAKVVIAIELLFAELKHLNKSISTTLPCASMNALGHIWDQIARSQDPISEFSRHRYVTFNYDRVIEHFFLHSFKHTLGLDQDRLSRLMYKENVVHVYGKIGDAIPEQEAMDFQYDSQPYNHYEYLRTKISEAVYGLRLISPHRSPEPVISKIAQSIRETDRVVMLGYGFDPINNQILKEASQQIKTLPNSMRRDGYGRFYDWYASAMGKYEAELRDAQATLAMHPDNFGHHDENDVVFMRRVLSNLD